VENPKETPMATPIPNDAGIRPLLVAVLKYATGPVEISHEDLGAALLDVATDHTVLTAEDTGSGVRLTVTTA
jgi:hypothetical protein